MNPVIGWPPPPFDGAVQLNVTEPLFGVAKKPVGAPNTAWVPAIAILEGAEVCGDGALLVAVM